MTPHSPKGKGCKLGNLQLAKLCNNKYIKYLLLGNIREPFSGVFYGRVGVATGRVLRGDKVSMEIWNFPMYVLKGGKEIPRLSLKNC